MSHTICYISRHASTLDEVSLQELFSFVLKHNPPKDITGILLSSDSFFLQVLEGEKQVIQLLFESIQRDQRHKDILTVLDQGVEKRIFDRYRAGFSIVKTKEDLHKLYDYLSLYDVNHQYSKNIQRLLGPFLI